MRNPIPTFLKEVKNAIFALAKGQITEPVKQPNGFYLFRMEQLDVTPYERVKDEIFTEIQQSRFREWFEKERAAIKITFDDEKYFEQPQQQPVPAAPAAK